MMLRSRTLKTKKRLSSEHWIFPIAVIALMGVIFILNTSMRMVALSFHHGIVRGKIPVLPVPTKDDTMSRVSLQSEKTISEDTTTIVLKANQDLIFGPIKAFASEYPNPRNKFIVKNLGGSAQFRELIGTMNKWQANRYKKERIENDGIAILVPAAKTPVNIIIQAISELRKSEEIENVILANGML